MNKSPEPPASGDSQSGGDDLSLSEAIALGAKTDSHTLRSDQPDVVENAVDERDSADAPNSRRRLRRGLRWGWNEKKNRPSAEAWAALAIIVAVATAWASMAHDATIAASQDEASNAERAELVDQGDTLDAIRDAVTIPGTPTADPPAQPPDSSAPSGSYAGGWGPERDLFTSARPSIYVVLNSITDNPAHGDERNFVQVRQAEASNETYGEVLRGETGLEYVVYAWVANNVADNLASPVATVHGLRARFITNSGSNEHVIGVILSAKNATEVWDGATIFTRESTALEFVEGSGWFHTNPDGGFAVGDELASDQGALLGQFTADGELPVGHDETGAYLGHGYLTFRVKVVDEH
ncbi:hypothetical protein [Microbacterium hominis]|uniref:Uncharacterized protein n=1 Tax=Microbacterium hominis TaxID=162426 RepID=A0A7D4UA53_9MICO|nr:hypothetical protein [Microbacterium hominis]QKJ18043.1 hypothetical protein HQM25_00500 [Microbacterium hominis]